MNKIHGGQNRIYDAETSLHLNPAALTASAAGSDEAGDPIIRDIGQGRAMGELCIDLGFLDVASDDELYYLELQGSNTDDFSDDIVILVASVESVANVLGTGMRSPAVGDQLRIPFTNQKANRTYRYVRLFVRIAGTSPQATLRAFYTKLNH